MRRIKIFSLYDYKSTEDLEKGVNDFIEANSLETYSLNQSESQVVSTIRTSEGGTETRYTLSLTITLDYEVEDESSSSKLCVGYITNTEETKQEA